MKLHYHLKKKHLIEKLKKRKKIENIHVTNKY